MKLSIVSVLLLFTLVACTAPYKTHKTETLFASNPTVEKGIDRSYLDQMTAELETLDFHAVLVFKDGSLIYERYFAREDEHWGEDLGIVNFDAATLHDLRSGTKSIVAALIGIAIFEGKISSLDTPVANLLSTENSELPENLPGQPALLLRHLLTMSAGFDWNEQVPYTNPQNSEIQMWENDSPVSFALSRPRVLPPGAAFNYNGGLTQILVSVLEQNTGMPIQDYAKEKLFEPLGIVEFEWIEHPSGQAWGPSGLRLNARDFAKIGQLLLWDGDWYGQRILPASWVAQSMSPQIDMDLPLKYEYGLHWYVPGYVVDGSSIETALAQGNGAQCLLLFPDYGLLIVTLAGYYNQIAQSVRLPNKLTQNYILPAVGISGASIERSR